MAEVRAFFAERRVLEVDTPILSSYAPVDAHIDVMEVDMGRGQTGYLHTSPEYGLKKLLAAGSGDIYQLSHVFRQNEEGPLHLPEFMMLEWYRLGIDYLDFIEETLDIIRLFVGPLPSRVLTYREALLQAAGFDYTIETDFARIAEKHQIALSPESADWNRDTWLSLLFSHLVEPHLGKEELTVITEYPASQAALAKTTEVDGIEVARRFEIYREGIELANGFDELTNAKEQRKRLEEENALRISMGKKSLPIDESFLATLESGLPECCGVAVGFDRLMMLFLETDHLHPWTMG